MIEKTSPRLELSDDQFAALNAILDDLHDEQGLMNYEEDNYEAGWHHALHGLRERMEAQR